MKTPSFWNTANWLSTALLPLGWIYGNLTALRFKFKRPQKVSVPVICIGNLTAGGTGKTPTAATIAEILRHEGYTPFFISRGYGGSLSGIIVDPTRHSAAEVGDEPLLLSRYAPVSINADRVAAARLAISHGADILIMDDGFQNPMLHKDLSFLVIDGVFGLGNERPIPSGPLRESIDSGIKRAQAALIIGEDKHHLSQRLSGLTKFYGEIKPQLTSAQQPCAIIAFAGIGRPDKFYTSLKSCGFELLQTYDFPDHHFYTEKELQKLIQEAQSHKVPLYTTGKDYVKIPPHLRSHFNVLEISIHWHNHNRLKEYILQNIKR